MKKYFTSFTAIAAIVFVSACGGGATEKEQPESEQKDSTMKAEKAPVNPDMIADLGISGMSCEINCVSSVRKTLLKMEGVASFEMEFDANQDVNHAIVKFDSKVVSRQEMIDAVQAVNEEAYTVESSEEKPIDAGSDANVTTSENESGNSGSGSGPSLSLYSILDFIF